jgi:hypothetical protein
MGPRIIRHPNPAVPFAPLLPGRSVDVLFYNDPDLFKVSPMPAVRARTGVVRTALATALLAAAVVGATDGSAPPDGFTQLGVHEHGKVVVNIAVEGGTLTVELDAAAMNVVGFERAPRNPAEWQRLAEVDRWLGSGVSVLGVPAAAGCVLSRVEYLPPGLVGDDRDHNHDHGQEGAVVHADYEARFTYACANATALDWTELWLLRRLEQVTQVEVNLVTPRKQTRLSVTGAAARVALE